ncbi:hypothetical protein ACWA2B_04480 [Paenibacillus sp. CMM36]
MDRTIESCSMPCYGGLVEVLLGALCRIHFPTVSRFTLAFDAGRKAGIWDEGLEHVSLDSDEESVMIDATIVRIHQQDLAQKG